MKNRNKLIASIVIITALATSIHISSFAATANSLPTFVKIFAFCASVFSFFRFILFHLECPDT